MGALKQAKFLVFLRSTNNVMNIMCLDFSIGIRLLFTWASPVVLPDMYLRLGNIPTEEVYDLVVKGGAQPVQFYSAGQVQQRIGN